MSEPVPPYRDTPHGRLYRPLSEGLQLLVLIGTFFSTLFAGKPLGALLGGVSNNAGIALHVPFVAVFFFGYGLWVARLNALAFDLLGRSLLKVLFTIIIRRKKPESIDDVLPSPEKLELMAVRAQKAGGSFVWAGYAVAAPSAVLALLIQSNAGTWLGALMVLVAIAGWGHALAFLGRRGYLPFMENG